MRRGHEWNRTWIFLLPILFVMVGYILYPLSSLIIESLRPEDAEGLRLKNYLDFFDYRTYNYFLPLLNSLKLALAVVVSTNVLGLLLAFLFVRYDFPGRSLMHSLVVIPLIIPGFIAAQAYKDLYGEYGLVIRAIQALFHLSEPPFYIRQFSGCFVVETVALLPLAFLTISAVLSRFDLSLEEAAQALGASRRRTFFRVTLPLVLPGVMTGSILVFMMSMENFGVPLFMGYRTLPVAIWRTKQMGGASMAAALSVILTWISLVFFGISRWILSRRSYVSLSRGIQRTTPLRGALQRYGAAGLAGLIVLVMLLPIPVIVLMSLTEPQNWDVTELLPPFYTLENYTKIFTGRLAVVVKNSLSFATIATLMAVVYGTLVAYVVVKRRFRGRSLLDAVASLPYAIPGTVIGVAFILAFNRPTLFTARTLIVATPAIIILAYFIRRAPYVVRSVSASFHQLDDSLEEAALNLGASWRYAFRRVVVPLILPGLVAGTMLTFITAVAELSTSILLYTPDTMTIPISIYTKIYGFDLGVAAALSMVQIGVAFLALLVINVTVGMKALKL